MPSSITSPGCSQTGGLQAHADPGGCSGVDQVAGFEDQELAQIVHDEIGIEDHRRGGPVLPAYAADVEPHGQIEHVVDLVRGHQPRPGRVEGLRRFALGPLPAAFGLKGAFADVVDHGVSGDGGVGLLDRVEIAGPPADHDAQLDLPVGFRRAARDPYVVVRADQRVRRLGEQDRLIGDRRPGLGRVVAVVQADAQDLVRPGDRGADPFAGEARSAVPPPPAR